MSNSHPVITYLSKLALAKNLSEGQAGMERYPSLHAPSFPGARINKILWPITHVNIFFGERRAGDANNHKHTIYLSNLPMEEIEGNLLTHKIKISVVH
jgi:hypothetical protein